MGLFCGGKRSRMEMSPKAILTVSTRRTTFMLNVFWSEVTLRVKLVAQNRLSLALPIRQGVWWGAPFSASSQSCILIALTFAYKLGLECFLYRNRSFRRDEDNLCRSLFHMRQSWGCNHPNSILDTKSQNFEHNFGLRDECWKYALEAIINGYYYISLFMVIVYYSCYNCIVRKS